MILLSYFCASLLSFGVVLWGTFSSDIVSFWRGGGERRSEYSKGCMTRREAPQSGGVYFKSSSPLIQALKTSAERQKREEEEESIASGGSTEEHPKINASE